MDDLVPTEEEIKGTVKLLHNHHSGGTSGMQDEHLKGWLEAARKNYKEEAEAEEKTVESNRGGEATEDTSTEASNCAMVVELVKTAFKEGRLAEEATWQAVVLIPKGGKD